MKQLLELLDLQGRIITVDALGCQSDSAQKITYSEGDYVMALKGNQKNLLEDVKEYFTLLDSFVSSEWHELDKGHGRREKRSCWALPLDTYLKHHEWPI